MTLLLKITSAILALVALVLFLFFDTSLISYVLAVAATLLIAIVALLPVIVLGLVLGVFLWLVMELVDK